MPDLEMIEEPLDVIAAALEHEERQILVDARQLELGGTPIHIGSACAVAGGIFGARNRIAQIETAFVLREPVAPGFRFGSEALQRQGTQKVLRCRRHGAIGIAQGHDQGFQRTG